MSRLEKASEIIQWAIDNKKSLKEAQAHFHVGEGYIRKTKARHSGKEGYSAFIELYKRFHATATPQQLGKTTYSESDDSASYEYSGTKSIKTLEEAIELFKIDLTKWEVERWVCNSWDVNARAREQDLSWKDGVMNGHAIREDAWRTVTNYQIKVWLKKIGKGKSYFDIKDEMLAEIKEYAPKYPSINYEIKNEGHLLVVDPADIHIGKLASSFETGETYNNQIAVDRIRAGVAGILEKSKGFNIDKILLVVGNDILHIDTPKRTTTSGTPQDTDGMWYDNFKIAKQIYVEVIESLIQLAPVHVQYDPSNHDYTNGFFLADTLSSWFSNSTSVTFNCGIAHRKYFVYGDNLIGTTHGDGAKETDLPLLMAHEAKEWSACTHRYFYTHHIHHKKSRDYMGVCVESLRSPSGTDSWHHRNGYVFAPKAIEGFIHHKTNGQIARITHIF